MAIFGFGKKEKEQKAETKASVVKGKAPKEKKVTKVAVKGKDKVSTNSHSDILLGTRVTEKASFLAEKQNVYTFLVSSEASKGSVEDAVAKLYNVHPLKVRLVSIPSKRVFVRGKRGVKSGGRKAYVYLKQGEKIDIA